MTTEIKLNKALEADVLAGIEAGWWVQYEAWVTREKKRLVWELVVGKSEPPGFGIQHWTIMRTGELVPGVVLRKDLAAAKPHKNAPAFLFNQPDTVTREDAEKMVKSGPGWEESDGSERWGWTTGAGLEAFHLSANAKYIKNDGGNVYAIQEEKP